MCKCLNFFVVREKIDEGCLINNEVFGREHEREREKEREKLMSYFSVFCL